jgi:hypothetical protein
MLGMSYRDCEAPAPVFFLGIFSVFIAMYVNTSEENKHMYLLWVLR